jgi:hypothetical protein
MLQDIPDYNGNTIAHHSDWATLKLKRVAVAENIHWRFCAAAEARLVELEKASSYSMPFKTITVEDIDTLLP